MEKENKQDVKFTGFINPYSLLGFEGNPNNIKINDVKKNYYKLALLCHPDKGGSQEDMNVLHNSYLYVKEQIELKNDNLKEFEEVEEAFFNFMKEQVEKPPPFSKVYEEAHLWLEDFNKKFMELDREKNEFNDYNPYGINEGYGELMEKSEIADLLNGNTNTNTNTNTINTNTNTNTNTINTNKNKKEDTLKILTKDINKPISNHFTDEIILYTSPTSYNIGGNFGASIKGEKVNDFSTKTGDISLCDYKKAYSLAKDKDITLRTIKVEKNNTDIENIFNNLLEERGKPVIKF